MAQSRIAKLKRNIILIILILCLSAWLIPLTVCEILTLKYSDCIGLYHGFESYEYWIDASFSRKILSYTHDSVEVYYFSDSAGLLVTYRLVNGEWIPTSQAPEILWSLEGNADKIVFPYWHHCIHFLF
ncbi:MAG: hypothetical protein IJX62_07775 [Clostridia bacterium]|nr:hypothetical protein [Clostridia bacterium]